MNSIPNSIVTISICPLFPSKSIVLVQNLEDMLVHMNTRPRITYNELRGKPEYVPSYTNLDVGMKLIDASGTVWEITETDKPLGWFHYFVSDCNNAHRREVNKLNL